MGPPDLILNIGSINFFGHSYLLSSFSEVLKAACNDCPVESGAKKIIQLSNISPDFINHILFYFYSGQLNLNEDNVLGILFVSHALRIPKIATICNDYLLKNQVYAFDKRYAYDSSATNKKDVFNTVIRPVANKPKPINTAFEGPISSHVWLPSSSTTFKPLKSREKWTDTACYLPIIPNNAKINVDEKLSGSKITNNNDDTIQPKLIIDIANCDGPVRFKKILNTAYNATKLKQISEYTKIDNCADITKNKSDDGCMKKRSNIQNIDQSNKCIHCNQLFKSKFCFQKHKMRHLNNGEYSKTDILKEPIQMQYTIKRKVRHCKRDVKPLDMNVQYYPCKTCGVKFPSYYFVHKHRKLCHSDEEN